MFKNNIFLVCLCFSFCFIGAAQSTERIQQGIVANEKGQVRKWNQLPIKLCLQENFPKQYQPSVQQSIKIWNDNFKKEIFSLKCPTDPPKNHAEDLNIHGIYWIQKNFSRFTEKTSLARTIRSYDEEKNQIIDADIVVNAEFIDWPKTSADLVTVMVHELGHVLGLKHNFLQLNSAMNYFPYQSGLQFRRLGQYESQAINAFYFNDGPGIPNYLDRYLQGDLNDAARLLGQQKPNSDQLYSLGVIYKSLKDHSKALSYFEKSSTADPKNELKLTALADAHWSLQDTKKASQLFQKVLELNFNNYEASANLGAIFANAGKESEAVVFFENALRTNPMHYISCFYLARITKNQKYLTCVEKYSPDKELYEILKAEWASSQCKSCVAQDQSVLKELSRLGNLSPTKILSEIRNKDVCVRILVSGRKAPTKSFYWGSVEPGSSPLTELSKIKNIMGKTLCKGEIEFAKSCPTIALADDAPKSTLLHEYIHIEQIKKDPSWCTLSKKLWRTNKVSQEEAIEIRNREWDALKTLWLLRDKLNLATEDLVTISSEILEEAKKRESFDPKAKDFVAEENIQFHFFNFMKDYKKQLGL